MPKTTKKSKFPTELCIFGRTVKVEILPVVAVEGSECDGCYDPETKTISLAEKLDEESRFRVLIHEMTHASMDISGLSELIPDVKMEEAICVNMESLAAVLKLRA